MIKNIEDKAVTISEGNRFHQFREKIAEISRKDGSDIGTSARKLAHAMAWTGYSEELKEFDAYIAYLTQTMTKSNNLILKYFGGDRT